MIFPLFFFRENMLQGKKLKTGKKIKWFKKMESKNKNVKRSKYKLPMTL